MARRREGQNRRFVSGCRKVSPRENRPAWGAKGIPVNGLGKYADGPTEILRGLREIVSFQELMRIVSEQSNCRVLLSGGGGHASLQGLALRCGYRVGEVCDALGCGERYLHEVFVRDLGMPPKLWMKGERMTVARRRLKDGTPPREVAAELGYQGVQHFRREFRGVFGVTPVEFQQPQEIQKPGETEPA